MVCMSDLLDDACYHLTPTATPYRPVGWTKPTVLSLSTLPLFLMAFVPYYIVSRPLRSRHTFSDLQLLLSSFAFLLYCNLGFRDGNSTQPVVSSLQHTCYTVTGFEPSKSLLPLSIIDWNPTLYAYEFMMTILSLLHVEMDQAVRVCSRISHILHHRIPVFNKIQVNWPRKIVMDGRGYRYPSSLSPNPFECIAKNLFSIGFITGNWLQVGPGQI